MSLKLSNWTWGEMEKFVENYPGYKAVCRKVVDEKRLPQPDKYAKKSILHRYQKLINSINDSKGTQNETLRNNSEPRPSKDTEEKH